MMSQESRSATLFESFLKNQMRANPEKCNLLMNVNRPATTNTGKHALYKANTVKNYLVLKSIVNSILTTILKSLLKMQVKRYMLWLELHPICVIQKES